MKIEIPNLSTISKKNVGKVEVNDIKIGDKVWLIEKIVPGYWESKPVKFKVFSIKIAEINFNINRYPKTNYELIACGHANDGDPWSVDLLAKEDLHWREPFYPDKPTALMVCQEFNKNAKEKFEKEQDDA